MQWRVRLFDGPLLENPSGELVRRFRSQKVGALLAYLSLRLGRPCPREELADAVWPEEMDTQVVANRLRVALASLRRQLEPPGVPFGSVLDVSMPGCVCLRSETVWCDVAAFEASLKTDDATVFAGSLLPGFYEDWALLERERLEALAEGLPTPAAAPVERTPTAPPTGERFPLPLYLTRWIGRQAEIEQLADLVQAHRLVSLTGPGGMGKTRLAVETARGLASPAIFVPLADVANGEGIPEAILRAARISPSVEADLVEQAIAFLSRREDLILILDNAEHIVEPVSDIAIRLLQAIPALRILVTSRRRLDLPGEATFPLSPLEMPSNDEDLLANPAVALFVDRARNARPDFVLGPRHEESVREICRLVEGMPLALELAAARVIAQTPAQIAEALRTSLTDLKSRQRGLSPRHQSLRASIQGSYDLLPPELQRFFAQLSVFRGGWTADAAERVTGVGDTEWLLEDLASRSLVSIREDPDAIRYLFLEAIRQFADEQLTDSERESLRHAHAEYFLEVAANVSEDDIATLVPLDAEQENLLLALETLGETSSFWNGVSGALTYAHVRGKHRTFLPWAERALQAVEDIPEVALRVRLHKACYYVFSYLGQIARLQRIGEAIRQDALSEGFAPGEVIGNLILAYALGQDNRYEAGATVAREALRRAKEIGDETLVWRSLRICAFLLVQLAIANADPAQASQAEALSRECLATLPPSSTHLTFEQLTLAYSVARQGRVEEGYRCLKTAQNTALRHGMHSMLLFAFREECRIAAERGDFEYAARFYGAFLQLRETTGYNIFDRSETNSAYTILEENLPAEKLEALIGEGGQVSPWELAHTAIPNI